jgi:hypothetical protein
MAFLDWLVFGKVSLPANVKCLDATPSFPPNFVKIHGSIRCTPAMEAGIEKSAWTVSDLVNAA